LFFIKNGFSDKDQATILGMEDSLEKQQKLAMLARGVTNEDHILGNPNAPVKIIQYSDTECPYCKQFMETMKKIMNIYGKKGEVAWVYRHLPGLEMHPKAQKEAEAIECAGELGGEDVFWKYVDRLMEVTPSHNNLDLALLPEIAEYAGLDRTQFENCVESGKYKDKVTLDMEEGIKAGAIGTPFIIMITSRGERFPINGAEPYSVMKNAIDIALAHHTESENIDHK